MKSTIYTFLFLLLCIACKNNQTKIQEESTANKTEIKQPIYKFGYNLDDYIHIQDTIERGESFGVILDRHHLWNPEIYKISNTIKDSFDVRRIRAGKPYTVLAKKDSTEKAQVFIYQHDKIHFTVVDFRDSIFVKKVEKEVKTVVKETSGVITSSLSQSLDKKGAHPSLANELSEIYAWTIDFFRLQKNDSFKVIYEQKYIDDTIPAGIGRIKAAYFKHAKRPFYAFEFVADSVHMIPEYFDDNAQHLRRAFLKAPLKFSRISSRFNLRRKIALYGRVKPHLGTDFAAPVGTPIMSTANGKVIESRKRGGNGNYVKVRHNATYSTQYLHMKRRKVNVGDYVKQGDVIGWVGMTGNTSGPHVCYRFWKNGRQVDPLKQKLPEAEEIPAKIKPKYLTFITPIKEQLDAIN